jgi:glycosyltransferase involved in cell wall biosynthesis
VAHALEVEASAYARYGEAAAPDATKREAVRVRRNPKVRIQGLRAGQAVPRDPLRVHGWALPSARSALTRVEILVDGRSAGRARLGLPRPGLTEREASAEAPVCGFEHLVPPSFLAEAGGATTIQARAHLTDGSHKESGQVTLQVVEPEPRFDDAGGRAEELRRRVDGVASYPLFAERRPREERLRLLAFTHDLQLGGAQLYLLDLLRRLNRRDDFSCVLVAREDGPLRGLSEVSGIPVHVSPDYGYSDAEAYEGKLAELAALARLYGINAVMANTTAAFIGVDLAGRLGVPSVWKIHESLEVPAWSVQSHHWPVAGRYPRERFGRVLGTASAVVFAAEATCRQYRPWGSSSRFLTIPYGIDHGAIATHRSSADRAAVRAELGLPGGATVILCLGTLEGRKAQSALVQAFSRVADAHPHSVLCLVGSRGDSYAKAVQEYLARKGLERRVWVRPLSDAVYDWLLASDLLVCASDIESLPFSILEAMAFGTPVLSTRIFGIPTLIEDGRTGYLCEPRDIDSLARGLERALRAEPEERAEITRAAAERVRSGNDIDRYVQSFSSLLFSLLPRPNVDGRSPGAPE